MFKVIKNENNLFKDDSNVNADEINVLDNWELRMLLNEDMKYSSVRKKDNN